MNAPTATLTDTEIANELTAELIEVSRIAPFKLGVRFDAKEGPCRIMIHNVEQKGTLGTVAFGNKNEAAAWIRAALLTGYTVLRAVGREWPHERSIAARRRYEEQREKWAKMSPAEKQAIDDEIPF